MARDENDKHGFAPWHGTTILLVRKGSEVVLARDGQVTVGHTVMKSNAKKVRRLGKGQVIAGFAGATADALTLFERLEAKLEQYPAQLARARPGPPRPAIGRRLGSTPQAVYQAIARGREVRAEWDHLLKS